MKRFIVGFLAVIGALSIMFFLGTVLLVVIGLSSIQGPEPLPDRVVLEIDLEHPVVEDEPIDPFARLVTEKVRPLREVVGAIDAAREDDRVLGLVAYLGRLPLGTAQLQEVRDAVLRFRESGKPAFGFAETCGEFSSGNASFYLACAFDRIYLQPSGDVGLTGVYLEHPFLRGTLEKLDVEPRIAGRHEYKTAKNLYTERSFTEAHEDAAAALVRSLYAQMADAIAEGRGLSRAQVDDLVDQGPFLGADAVRLGLVDSLLYVDEAWGVMERELDEIPEFVSLERYISEVEPLWTGADRVAVVYVDGQITRGPSEYDAVSGSSTVGAETVARGFREAMEDRRVRAIVLRVRCPGGSYVASDAVRRLVLEAQAAGLPVVVSMSDYAASGGYFISMAADRILAQPGTLTGSIGVYGGKLVMGGLFEKLGVTFDTVQEGENAGMWSLVYDYSETEWDWVGASLDRIYEDFTTKVAESRGLDLAHVREIARGRVWTGADAIDIGLIDEIGGFHEALAAAAELGGLAPEARYRLQVYPRKQSTLEALAERGSLTSNAFGSLRAALLLLDPASPVFEALRAAVQARSDGALLDPSVRAQPLR